jgi:hypothetical protein
MRFGCSSECYECRDSEPIGSLAPAVALLFPALPSRFSPDTGPRSLAFPGSSSPELTATSEYYPLYTCTVALAPVRLPWGFVPPSRHQHRESTTAGNPTFRLRSALSVSHALDGLLLSLPRGLVSSRCRVRGSLLRGFPRPSAALAHHQAVPSWRSLRSPAPSKLNAPARVARLQGFDPTVGPLLPASGLDSPTLDPLSSFHSLRISSEHLGDAFAPPPSMTFPASSSL